jgi:hypothetical protein
VGLSEADIDWKGEQDGRDRTRRLRGACVPGNQFKGEIVPALEDLVKAGTVRIIDTAFVGKDEKGEIFTLEVTELDPEVQEALDALDMEVQGLFNDDELLAVGQELDLNSSAAVLVWENVWARKVAQAIRDAGGVMVAFERIPHDIVQAAREWALEEAKA